MEIIKFIQSFSNPFLDHVFTLATMMGEDTFFILVFTVVFWCIDKKFGYKLGFACLSSIMLNMGLKECFKVPRPIGQPGIRSLRLETAGGYSFPSGHTQSTASLWTSIAVKFRRKYVSAAGIVLTLLVGVSRLYLGVHFPSDVIFGALFGVCWVFLANWIFDMAEEKGKRFAVLLFIIPAVVLPAIFNTSDCMKASGTIVGLTAGYLIESRYIRFDVKGPFIIQAVKYIIGIAGLIVIKVVLKQLLPQVPVSDFLRYMLIGLWAAAIAPWLFKAALGEKTAYSGNIAARR